MLARPAGSLRSPVPAPPAARPPPACEGGAAGVAGGKIGSGGVAPVLFPGNGLHDRYLHGILYLVLSGSFWRIYGVVAVIRIGFAVIFGAVAGACGLVAQPTIQLKLDNVGQLISSFRSTSQPVVVEGSSSEVAVLIWASIALAALAGRLSVRKEAR